MVDIIPSSQMVIGNGAFSIVYRAKLKSVSVKKMISRYLNSLLMLKVTERYRRQYQLHNSAGFAIFVNF